MNPCKKILLLLSFFAFLVPSLIVAETFQVVDLERLIKNHPLMQRYDPTTGRFRQTPSEIRTMEELKSDIASITQQIEVLQNEKKSRVENLISNLDAVPGKEEQGWAFLNECDEKIAQHRDHLKKLENLCISNGVPGFETVIKIATEINNDVLKTFVRASDTIVLNKLPRFRHAAAPDFKGHELRNFFWNHKADTLEHYLSKASLVALLFSCTDNPVILPAINERLENR